MNIDELHDETMEDDELNVTKQKKLPPEIENLRTRVKIGKYSVSQTNTYSYHGAFKNLGFDNSFKLSEFKKNFKIKILKRTKDELVFDMIGIDAAIANAFRRILISEVPTMAIEHVVIVNNTSIIQDEILAHRLGLIPIKADPRRFNFSRYAKKERPGVVPPEDVEEQFIENQPLYENEMLLFKLDVTCKKNKKKNAQEPYINSSVYSGSLQWVPFGKQKETFKDDPPRPVFNDILIAKLRPGQQISVECYVEKGIGFRHAKWSPVATATYRLLPEISLLEEITGKEAKELKKKCPMNVFDIEDDKAIVSRPRDCTMCRECIREDGWEEKVRLSRVKDHFIFSIESTGILPPDEIFREALRVFWNKCDTILKEMEKLKEQEGKKKTKKVFQ